MTEHSVTHIVGGLTGAPRRLDAYVTDSLRLFPRSQLKQRLVRLLVNGKEAKPARKVKEGDRIDIVYTDPPPVTLEPEEMALDILFENDDVIVLNKPRGLVVHPGAGHRSHTLVNGLLAHCAGLAEAFSGLPLRPGIVHRLDKDTSGVIIAAKHPAALEHLARQFRKRQTRKLYLAFAAGRLKERAGTVETVIARDRAHRQRFIALRVTGDAMPRGKFAVTAYRVLREWPGESLVSLRPSTGRTHQLRVHLKYLGAPVVGDAIYGKGKAGAEGPLLLHAYKLKLRLPGEKKARVFTAPVPRDFKKRLRRNGRGGPAH